MWCRRSSQPVRAVEMMDAATLRLSADNPLARPSWARLPAEAAGLLVEFRAPNNAELAVMQASAAAVVGGLALWEPAEFTSDRATSTFFWYVRANLMAGLGKNRPLALRSSPRTSVYPPTGSPMRGTSSGCW